MREESINIRKISPKISRAFNIVENKRTSNISILDGKSGDLLFLYNMFTKSNDIQARDLIYKILDETQEITFDINYSTSGLWSGPIGYAYVLDIIKTELADVESINQTYYRKIKPAILYILSNYDRIFPKDMRFDAIYGISSVIMFISLHSIALADSQLVEYAQKLINNITLEDIIESISVDKKSLFFPELMLDRIHRGERVINVGFAHGLAGIVHNFGLFSNKFCYRSSPFLLAKKMYNKIIAESHNQIPEFWNLTNNHPVYTHDNTNISWCYGQIGHAQNVSVDNEYILYSDCDYLSNGGLCHGLSGLIYYKFRNEQYPLNVLRSKLELCNYHSKQTEEQKNGFLNGIIGEATALLSLYYNTPMIGEELFGYNKGDVCH